MNTRSWSVSDGLEGGRPAPLRRRQPWRTRVAPAGDERQAEVGSCHQAWPRVGRRALRAVAAVVGLVAVLVPAGSAESLWKDEQARPMFADKKAGAVGDLLTVVVQELNSASKDKNTQTSKKAGIDASIATFLYSPAASGLLTKGGQMPALKMNSQSDFTGSGAINNSEKITAQFAVRIVDVLPNRNLVIEGTRETAFSGEQQTIILRGVVRPDDITSGNTVFSQNVADASIKFISKGALTDAQRKGWLHRIWDKVAPF